MTETDRHRPTYVQHYSTRVPWKDNGFIGTVDDDPTNNVAAEVITNIAMDRDIEFEEMHQGKTYLEVGPDNFQHWITENAAFMSEKEIPITLTHPYSKDKRNEKFTHYVDTTLIVQPYSFLLRPFSWTLMKNAKKRAKFYNYYFNLDQCERMLDWDSIWVSHGESQKGIFEYFFSGFKPNESLIFPYYKQVPFVDDSRRVIAGIGNITSSVKLHTYDTDGTKEETNFIWETNVRHSIREDASNGFLLPYDEIYQYAKEHPDFDVSTVTLFEPPGFRNEFSYAAEWVSYDAAIAVLNEAKVVLQQIAKLKLKKANGAWVNRQLDYVERQLENVWKQRGIYPGLGAMLSAFGVKYGYDIARLIPMEGNDFFETLDDFFSGERVLLDVTLDESLADKEDEFYALRKNKEKAALFELLSRMNISFEQAEFAWETLKDRAKPIIENPYLLYELSRTEKEEHQISISQIDYAMFPHPLLKDANSLRRPTRMRTESDKRRFRALITFVLVEAVSKGHSLLPYEQIIEAMKELPLEHKTDFTEEKIEGVVDFLQEGGLYVDEENRYVKLNEYQQYKELIRDIVKSRLDKKLPGTVSWQEKVDEHFGDLVIGNEENDQKARKEKATALEIIETHPLSVFVGRAGTGKTTALSLLGYSEAIRAGGILALTPTGKARVQLENAFSNYAGEIEFYTVAQLLIRSGGYNWNTKTYQLPTRQSTSLAETVIIDESSMLTEEMFAAVLKLVDAHAKRIIFVGDPNQLPPIGAGRPFFDLITFLKENYPEHVAELETEMRQGFEGDDLAFAKLFSDARFLDKDIINKMRTDETSERLKFIEYKGTEELETKIS